MVPGAYVLMKLLRRAAYGPARPPFARTPMHFEEIEPRILHSADLSPFALLDSPSPLAQARVVEGHTASEVTSVAEASRPRELVIIDASTPDYLKLADDIRAQAEAGRRVELVIVESGADGIREISEALSRLDGIEAVHIISHGSDAALRLGATSLDAAALQSRGAEIGAWSRALSADADLLIYGCDVAATAEGRFFVDALARITGADVAASDDLTGSAVLGGDWLLEYRAGAIEASIATTGTAQQAWQATLAAPVLSGTNNLPTIDEDPSSNNGIKVSQLIAGKVTDADAGALSGIAVTAVDNTNGTWQYTTNGGGAWTAFGAVSQTSARLLTDNANTSVRFVPNPDWNGTVASGITFRAWDQTTGTAGGTADVSSPSFTVRDNFDTASYSNNDGTANWSAGWIDSDGSFSSGQIQVAGNALELNGAILSSSSIEREANLAGATSLILSFDFNNQITLSTITLEVSSNGGGSYTQLANSFAGGSSNATFDITAFAAADTRIKFTVSGVLGGLGTFTVDNLQIAYVQALNGGTTAYSSTTASAAVTVTSVNDRPVGTDATLVTAEDTRLVLTAASFGFTDPGDTPANAFLGVKIGALPASGVLSLSGTAVSASQTISKADLDAGNLSYMPALNANGAGLATITFKVQDDGGGADTDSTNRTLTINVTPINDAPVGADATVVAVENASFVFTTAMFGFIDPSDTPANSLLAVKIESLPLAGSLELSGVAVTAAQSISAADITAGWLRFAAAPNTGGTGYASFTFRVQDNGGGADLDTVARTMTIDVVPLNKAPAGADNTVAAAEDTPYAFNLAAFGFSDPDNTPANNLTSVQIVSLPTAGVLKLTGVAVVAGAQVSAADIAAGQLVYTPAANAQGTGYATFTFRVRDDGGTAGGGVDLDPLARTMTIDVTAVNDAPVGVDRSVVTNEDTLFVFDATLFGFSDPADAPAGNALAVKITTLPGAGMLTLNGTSVTAGQLVSFADIAAGRLAFTPGLDGHGVAYASFTFQVQDDGGVANGGTDLDTIARTFTVNVASVNDSPAGAGGTIALAEDASLVLGTRHFGFSDVKDAPANNLLAVRITSIAGLGSLKLGGAAVMAGQVVSAADIAAGRLVYAAEGGSGAAHASFTFKVQDDGGGADFDAVAPTLTINVTPKPAAIAELVESVRVEAPVAVQQQTVQVLASAGASTSPSSSSPAATTAATAATTPPAASAAAGEPGAQAGAGEPAAGRTGAEPEPFATGATAGGASSAQFVQVGVQRLDAQQTMTRDSRGVVTSAVVQDAQVILAPDRVDASGTASVLSSGILQSSTAASSTAAAVESRAMVEQLDQMRDGLQEHSKLEASVTAASAAAGMSLSVGYVVWLLRGGVLVSTLLSSLPAWRLIDPLPVLGRMDDDTDGDGDENESDDSLESLVSRSDARDNQVERAAESTSERAAETERT